MNFAKFLRTPFLQKTSGRLLLKIFCVSWKILYFYHTDLTTNLKCGNYNGSSKNLKVSVKICWLFEDTFRLYVMPLKCSRSPTGIKANDTHDGLI